ncbi:hypothetical protein T01_10543, partial [Trichinella spiralis]
MVIKEEPYNECEFSSQHGIAPALAYNEKHTVDEQACRLA